MTTKTNTKQPAHTYKMTSFDFQGLSLRAVEIDGEPWFVVADVAKMLGRDPRQTSRHVVSSTLPSETKLLIKEDNTKISSELRGLWTTFKKGSARLVSEGGLYKFTLAAQRSNPKAREFQDWVTGTVLPAIRKDGAYIMGEEKVATGEMSGEDRYPRNIRGKAATQRTSLIPRTGHQKATTAPPCLPAPYMQKSPHAPLMPLPAPLWPSRPHILAPITSRRRRTRNSPEIGPELTF